MFSKIIPKNHQSSGFTLMEMVVVLAVFSLTAIMAVDLFLSISRVQRQTRNAQAVQSDARFALEAMAKEIRSGTIDYEYYKAVCQGGDNPGDPCPIGNECIDGGNCGSINLGDPTYVLTTRDQENNQIFYRRNIIDNTIEVCSNTSEDLTRCDLITDPDQSHQNNWQTVTPSQVIVKDLRFYIFPASNPFSTKNSCTPQTQLADCDSGYCGVDYLCTIPDSQPMVTIILETEGGSGAEQEKVNMQTTSTSMVYRR